jgi:hypothetical protein
VPEPGRDTAFAALALLRCRDRIGPLLNTVVEPRRSEVGAAVSKLEGLDDAQLKQVLAEMIRREDEALRDAVAQVLGTGSTRVSRTMRKWVARSVAR